ncbi:sodium:solute symporter [Flavitalea sp. BT771]|uniref:sodium:solute symporter n=1 Tax=Flavitalea sp. BT771 TaxID=3063329 RepID=UPI0026E26CDE|nr:sodium:solute symporter [Flavitalea sp. BT771]MDO6430989.1 sodium:solute symporter [Flavitalea sp. BT771]MDV6219896.1 sodium:solute symporter [Flavitalea sp. BT771]
MSLADWIVLILTLLGMIAYGLYKGQTSRDLDGYFLANRAVPWYMVLLGIMGTQASAVTFLSAPGQAYTDGMRFVQYYFGLPLAMVVLCITFVPAFHRLKVYTAYEFLEQRFDLKTRTLTSFLFLLQRGLSTGISISAPALILSSILGWDILWTNIFMGGLVIIYTVTGGAKAVAYTQQLQLIIIFGGMFIAGYMVIHRLPEGVGLSEALHIGGKAGKVNIITNGVSAKGFDWNDRYNLFSGVIGGFFLALSYFGTDQSQVGRYLTARSITESRLGLLMNGLVKVPMQFLILLLGVLVFAFYQFNKEPVFFNQSQVEVLSKSKYKDSLVMLERSYNEIEARRINVITPSTEHQLQQMATTKAGYKATIKRWLRDKEVGGDDNDTNYIFLRFVLDYLPKGLIGLLIAVIFLAAWGSIAATLNSLASCTIVDFHKRFSRPLTDEKEFRLSRLYTFFWGVFCVVAAQLAYNLGNSLIEAVNVLGSLFYGVILGVFLVAFYRKKVGGTAVFISALIVEAGVIILNILSRKGIVPLSFLWFNLVGAVGVVLLAELIQRLFYSSKVNTVRP